MLEKIALQKKLISKADYLKAIDACRSSENFENALKDYFITHDLIPPGTLEQLIRTISAIKIIKKNIRFGSIAVEMGLITRQTLEDALEKQKKVVVQKKKPKLIGEVLIESGWLTKEQIRLIVQEQNKSNLIIEPAPPSEPVIQEALPAKKIEKPDSSEKVRFGMILDIEDNGLSAFLRKTQTFNDAVTAEDIITVLLDKHLQYGIESNQAIEGFINSSGFRKNRFKIASGSPRITGKDARVEYYFDTDHLKAGKIDEEGDIDFKDRGEIPTIEAGTLMAQKFPCKESRTGRDIFGNELPSEPARDILLKTQTGAELSEDGMRVSALISGHPQLSWSGNINVIDTFLVKGDAGYQTGHIDYKGKIEVQGGLKNGFKITGVDITIGEIDGGTIHAQGNVTVNKGVNNATIYARGHVQARYIHSSTITCLGNVIVEKEIVDSHIESSGACQITGGNLVNNTMAFNQGVNAKNIGTEKTSPNTIVIGQDLFIAAELKAIEENIVELEKNRLALEKKKDSLVSKNSDSHQLATQTANELDSILEARQATEKMLALLEKQPEKTEAVHQLISEVKSKEMLFTRLDKELNERFDSIEKIETKIKEIDTAFADLEDQIDDLNQEKLNFTDWHASNAGKPIITVSGRVFAGTSVKSPHIQKETKETVSNVRIEEAAIQINDSNSIIYEIQINDTLRRR